MPSLLSAIRVPPWGGGDKPWGLEYCGGGGQRTPMNHPNRYRPTTLPSPVTRLESILYRGKKRASLSLPKVTFVLRCVDSSASAFEQRFFLYASLLPPLDQQMMSNRERFREDRGGR